MDALGQSVRQVQILHLRLYLPCGIGSLAVRICAFQESPAPKAVDGIGSVNGLDCLLCMAGVGCHTRCHQVLAMALPLAGAFLQFLTTRSRNTCRPVDALPELRAKLEILCG
jgi:hypothetical protein